MEFTPSNTKLKNVGGGGGGGGGGGRHIYFAFIYGFEIIPWHLHLPIHNTLLSKGEIINLKLLVVLPSIHYGGTNGYYFFQICQIRDSS